MNQSIGAFIESGKGVLGVEFGSTRIKAVLIGEDHTVLAAGGFDWENQLRDGVWTYDLADVWTGLQSAYAALRGDVEARYGVKLKKLAAMGVSAMMHGYLAFDAAGRQLAPFRTWRNSMTGQAADAIARDCFRAHGLEGYFTHSLGHGIGLQIHEYPVLAPRSEEVLKDGMVFSDEPGLYFAGEYGIRIEDSICLEGGKVRSFMHKTAHDLLIL